MKHLFFDLDGTLADSSEGILNCFTATFTELGIPVPDLEVLKSFIGPPLEASFTLFGDSFFVEKAVDIYKRYYEEGGVYQARLYPDIQESLEKLSQAGYPLSVATSKNEPMAIKMLENLGIATYFNGIFGSLGNDHKADVLQRGIIFFELAPDQAVMIGDTHFDMIGGKTVGTQRLGVTWGFGTEQSLIDNGAQLIAHTPEDIQNLLAE